MQRFQNILVVVDGRTENQAVVERAMILAQRNQARLTLVNTVNTLPRLASGPMTPEPPADAAFAALSLAGSEVSSVHAEGRAGALDSQVGSKARGRTDRNGHSEPHRGGRIVHWQHRGKDLAPGRLFRADGQARWVRYASEVG